MTTTTTTTTTTTPTPPTGPAIEVLAAKDPGARLSNQRFRLRDSDALVGPYAHLAAERERLSRLTWDHFDVQRLGATVGAVLTGLDLASSLPDIVIEDIRRALHEYKVIFFRDQPMTSAQHVTFARRFGSLEIHPFIPSNTGEPELVRFAKSSEVGGYENSWHHDVTWRATPSMGAVLHAIQVPDAGGDTLFSDMYAAYDGLADDVKSRIDTMEAEHD